ncbi:glycosyltransferase [Pacificibacter sp. AS14]|uniref:glycosyltransferase family 4 protein n=1 Tax=Alphaproteobacteria TaxID=28211 RepID=UPI00316BC1E7
MSVPKLRILHETNPQKYFPALFELAENGDVELVGTHRYSVSKEWLRAWLRDKTPFVKRTRNALGDLAFRFKIPFVKDETIVFGFAPWDWRLLIYRQLARRNRILYQTSWHDWRFDKTPRQPRPQWFARYMQRQWKAFVAHPNVKVIAVTPIVAQTVKQETGADATVIPHAVPEVFFKAGRTRTIRENGPLKLIYVGEISEKKGILILLDLMSRLHTKGVTLTVVGNGPLVPEVKAAQAHGVTFLGPIYDRTQLAQTMSDHDVLMLLSQRTKTWEELFGIVIVEAIAAGLAVISSDHIGPRGIFTPLGPSGLFDEIDVEAVERHIESLAADSEHFAIVQTQQCALADAYSSAKVSEQWHKHLEHS